MEAVLVIACPCLGDPAGLGTAIQWFVVGLGVVVALSAAALYWVGRRKSARLSRWAAANLPPPGEPGGAP
jgi:uncharacterized iron-regulated membrane protein